MTQAANEGTVAQQWTDDDIITRYQNAFGKSPDVYHMAFVRWVRANDANTIATQAARIEALEEKLQFAAQYKGYEARACPLCKYERGKFIEHCQMHKDMREQAAQLAFWKNMALGLKDEMIERGGIIDELHAQLAAMKGGE